MFRSALAWGGGTGCLFHASGRVQQWLPQSQRGRTGGCARFGGGVNWVELEPSFVMAVKH